MLNKKQNSDSKARSSWLYGFRIGGSKRNPRKYSRFTWIFGFVGFAGFLYFISHELADLFYFSFFGFFSTFFTAKLAVEMPDERYEENRLKAKAAAMPVPAIALFVIGFGAAQGFFSQAFVIIVASIGWAATFITYAAAFWYYEKH
jgi:hypothetical protein